MVKCIVGVEAGVSQWCKKKSMVQIAGCACISKLTTHAHSVCNTGFSDLEGVSLILNVSLCAGVMAAWLLT